MTVRNTTTDGIRHLLRRDIAPINRRLDERVSRRLGEAYLVATIDAPDWMSSLESFGIVRLTPENSKSYSALLEAIRNGTRSTGTSPFVTSNSTS